MLPFTLVDVALYFFMTVWLLLWRLPLLGVLLVLVQVPVFVFIALPLCILREFKITNLERRNALRPYTAISEFAAIKYITWALRTFRASTVGPILFGETPALSIHSLRRLKYGTEIVGDFGRFEAEPHGSFSGFWIRSRSRIDVGPDLVIYFVPGNLAGVASAYWYIEYLSALLVELQVRGFSNPAVLVANIQYYQLGCGYVSAFNQVQDGWNYLIDAHPLAVTLAKGSGIGGTLLLTLLLHLVRPFEALRHTQASNSRYITPIASSTGLTDISERDLLERTSADANLAEPLAAAELTEPPKSPSEASTDMEHDSQLSTGIFTRRKPDGLLLISPIPSLLVSPSNTNRGDIIGSKVLSQLKKQLVGNEGTGEIWARPGDISDAKWWAEALPYHGSVVMLGGDEFLRSEIETSVRNMKESGSIVIDEACDDQLHGWPILASLIASNPCDQAVGIKQVATRIAQLLVLECMG